MTPRAAIILQARMGSRRQPGKSMMVLSGRTLLNHCVWRLHATGLPVIVATTDRDEDDVIAAEASQLGAATFRGSSDDVLARYACAAQAFGVTTVVRATADNPAVDIDAPSRVLEVLFRARVDHVTECGLPLGAAVEAVTTDALMRAADMATEPGDREHVTPLIRRGRPFTALRAIAPTHVRHASLRLTVDTATDLEFMGVVLRPFAGLETPPALAAIIQVAEQVSGSRTMSHRPAERGA
jgi:spore coat polysaccharide biosynthesis protein SpsF (cytidylyltransferase family)